MWICRLLCELPSPNQTLSPISTDACTSPLRTHTSACCTDTATRFISANTHQREADSRQLMDALLSAALAVA